MNKSYGSRPDGRRGPRMRVPAQRLAAAAAVLHTQRLGSHYQLIVGVAPPLGERDALPAVVPGGGSCQWTRVGGSVGYGAPEKSASWSLSGLPLLSLRACAFRYASLSLSTSTTFKYYTGLIEKSKTHFYGPRSGLSGVLAFIEK